MKKKSLLDTKISMAQRYSYFKMYVSLPLTLWLLLLVSMYSVIVIQLDLQSLKLPELFDGGYEFEGTIFDFSVGYILSLMFYYITAFIPEVSARKAFAIFLNHQLKAFFLRVQSVVMALQMHQRPQQKQVTDFRLVDLDEIRNLFNNAQHNHPADPFEFNAGVTLWEQLLGLYPDYKGTVLNISLRSKVGDSKLDRYLSRIDSAGFFHLKRARINEPLNMNMVGIEFTTIHKMLQELSTYTNKSYGTVTFVEYIQAQYKTV